MGGVKRFQDLVAWKLCAELAGLIFELTENGPVSKDFGFRSQIRAAADSAAPMIAEGFGRYTGREFVRYLRMARGELAEVQSHLIVGASRNYFAPSDLQRAQTLADRAMGTTTNLLKSKLRQVSEDQAGTRRRGTGD